MQRKSVVIICLIFAVVCQARIITVDVDGPGDFNNIQAAIDDANNGDTIVVQPGTYQGQGNRDIDFKGKTITVKSVYGPTYCVIDCNASETDPHRGFYFHSGEDANSVVDCFTITGAYMALGWPNYRGGCIFCEESSPAIRNCIIRNNVACMGGGIGANYYADVQIYNCIIINNVATDNQFGDGGGVL